MRIQNNITAMNTHRMYTINNNNVAKSAEKLSSGYRINRAGDDAAGLAISEKMRAQIRGLNMASKNSQDAVSLIQTAEGALQEVHSMLQRMNELANQASTGTNETFDREQIDAEFNQLKEEIDQIADTTTFNNMKLLDGSLASDAANVKVDVASTLSNGTTFAGATTATYTVTGQTGLSSQVGSYAIAQDGGATSSKIKITFTDAETGDQTNTIIDLNDAVSADFGAGKAFKLDLSEAGLGIYEMTASNDASVNAVDLAAGLAANANSVVTKPIMTATGTLGSVDALAEAAAADPGSHGAISFSFDEAAITAALEDAGLDAGSYTLSLAANTGADQVDLVATDAAGTATILGSATMAGAATAGQEFVIQTTGGTTLGTITEAAYTNTGTQATAAEMETLLVGATGADDMGTFALTLGDSTSSVATSKGSLKIQVGANEGEQLEISVASMNTKGLGISNSSISDQTKAGAAITATQKAINTVSEQRATLGAMQNRLEHKIANLDNTSENLSAAESRIRDVDIAKEMTSFTKNNILSQASTAMLAQANAAPQGVLSLLQ
ncbi:MAG: flagellin [Candidatus Pelethousia sp.]|nr:flagellin [Candidatus Pelethousia sp.]